MNWFRGNRSLGHLLLAVGLCLVGTIWFLDKARNDWNHAAVRFNETAAELNRLERLAPYPSGENLHAMKAYAVGYSAELARLKDELKARSAFPIAQIAPNEFQSRLRLAMGSVAEKARANKVRLPDKFYLGFDEFISSLPTEVAAPLLGRELAQIEWLLDTLLESRVDALISFRRIPLLEGEGTAPPHAIRHSELIERRVVETTFVSAPAAARRVLNQIGGANQQFFIVRLLHVRSERDQGPPREITSEAARFAASPSASTGSPEAKLSMVADLNFIVGEERIETTAKIEIVRFLF